MAIHLLKFVDSIAASPTERLDVNDGTIFTAIDVDASPPRLRRAMGQNAMTNGGFVSSSQYDMRIVKATLILKRSTEDLNASQLQLLARELDRADNYLMFQPNGLTKPVFFVTKRSDFTAIREVPSPDASARAVEFELLAEPFALGLRETLGPYTVNNDPAHATNGCYFDVTGVIGDVAAPCVIVDTAAYQPLIVMGVRQHGTPSDLTFFAQAESVTLGTDTTNPGGGPDAAMSGTGTNNFARTDALAGAPLAVRLTWSPPGAATSAAAGLALRGTYRLWAVVRRSDATSVMRVAAGFATTPPETTVTLPLSTARTPVDLGLLSFDDGGLNPGGVAPTVPVATKAINVFMALDSGTGDLDWDFLILVPADEATLIAKANDIPSARDTTRDAYYDGAVGEAGTITSGGDLFAGTAVLSPVQFGIGLSGGFPVLVPGRTNRFVMLTGEVDPTTGPLTTTKSHAETLSLHYWPAYLYVRPSAT